MPKKWPSTGSAPDDRSSVDVARTLVERMLPDQEFLTFALGVASEVLQEASAVDPRSWSVTLFKRRVRVNGAWAWILEIGEQQLGIATKQGVLPAALIEELGDRVAHWNKSNDEWITLEPGDEHFWPRIKEASTAWIRHVGAGKARYAQTHSPGFVRYLELQTGHTFNDAWQLEQRVQSTSDGLEELVVFAASLPDNCFAESNALAAEEYATIVAKFPEAEWPSLPVARYALGQPDNDEVYSAYVEFRSPNLGSIKGGAAVKHGIYYSKAKQAWQHSNQYVSAGEAWQALRTGFVELFRLADEGDWSTLDEVSPLTNSIRVKTLAIYRPDRVIPIASQKHLRFFLEHLGSKHSAITSMGVLALNGRLLDLLRSRPELERFSNRELSVLLYQWKDPRETRRFIKVAPGENAKLWQECSRDECILVGWPGVGDLLQYETKAELKSAFEIAHGRDHKDHTATIARIVNDLWEYRDLEPGDRVVANRGTHEVLAVGEVQAPGYEFKPDRGEHPHYVPVMWDISFAKEVPSQPDWRNTIKRKIPISLQLLILGQGAVPPVLPPPPEFETIATSLEHKGQAVLFGPPGTGKTYIARRFALWWAGGDAEEVASALGDETEFSRFEAEVDATHHGGRTWLVVANPKKQEFAWDDLKAQNVEFTEGNVKRNFPLVEVGDLVVGYEAGKSSRIKVLGRVAKKFRESSEGRSFQVEHLCDIADGPDFKTLKADEVLKTAQGISSGCRGTLFALTESETTALLDLIEERDPSVKSYLGTTDATRTITRVTFHPSYAYEDFVEGFRPAESTDGTLRLQLEDGVFKRVCREAAVAPNKRFLLLIDELNRGNVAKIFGELITLLERDKRGMVVTLPQSKEAFSVPPNVYVLATMNTADRSLRHLDAALRRRFQFIELLPDIDLLAGYTVRNLALDDFLLKVNARIIKTFGREKQVGHSFLMRDGAPIVDEDEFAFRFRFEILPLIQEYCYDDFRQLAEFFGKTLVDTESERFNDDALGDPTQLLDALEQHFGTAARPAAE